MTWNKNDSWYGLLENIEIALEEIALSLNYLRRLENEAKKNEMRPEVRED